MNKNNKTQKRTIAVALSGGVDSACAAIDLIDEGYDVFAITMKIFENQDTSMAKFVAEKLNIKYYEIDLINEFKEKIIDTFINSYLEGYTPNPCLACNIHMKYGYLLKKAISLGASHLATGHYARIIFDSDYNTYHLKKSDNQKKDQTYNLYHLNQYQLSKLIFPLEKYRDKSEVKKRVSQYIYELNNERDSTDICFVDKKKHSAYIKEKINYLPNGNFIDMAGNYLGKHKGIFYYTIGQKRNVLENTNKYYVYRIDKESNSIILTDKEEDLYYDLLLLKDVFYTNDENYSEKTFKVIAKICQWGYELPAQVKFISGSTYVKLLAPTRAPAPGQSCVFYINDEVIGGGIIQRAEKLKGNEEI